MPLQLIITSKRSYWAEYAHASMDSHGTAHEKESPDKENGLPFAGKSGLYASANLSTYHIVSNVFVMKTSSVPHRHWRQSKLQLLINQESFQSLVQAMLSRSRWCVEASPFSWAYLQFSVQRMHILLLQAVPENRRKVALMKGIVIARKNRGWQSAFTIRNYLGNAGGIERTFPL